MDFDELKLAQSAHRLVESNLAVAKTRDYEDHTFSGIIFVLEVQTLLPIDFVEVHSVSVRGRLGRMSVYSTLECVSAANNEQFAHQLLRENVGRAQRWRRNYGPKMVDNRDPDRFVELVFDTPLRVGSGMAVGIYVHSEARGDQALVYDDQRESRYIASCAFAPTNKQH